MLLNERFGFGNLETLQFLWTSKEGVLLHRKLGEEIPNPTAVKIEVHSECKLPTADKKQRIVDLKTMFESVRTLRQGLEAVDSDCQNGHYTCKATGRDLAGHPLTCTVAGCDSKLRT